MKRLCTIFRLFILMHISIISYGQKEANTLVDLNVTNVSIKELVAQLESQTDYHFYYDSALFVNTTFTIAVKQQKLSKVLDQVFATSAIYYASDDNFHVFITKGVVLNLALPEGFVNNEKSNKEKLKQ